MGQPTALVDQANYTLWKVGEFPVVLIHFVLLKENTEWVGYKKKQLFLTIMEAEIWEIKCPHLAKSLKLHNMGCLIWTDSWTVIA